MEEFGLYYTAWQEKRPGTIERIEEIGIKTGSKSGQSLII